MIDQRQFILSREKTEQKENWTTVKLASGYYLSWQNNLRVAISRGKDVCLLGHVWTVDSQKPEPRQMIECGRDEILEAEKGWSGRYLLIIGDEIFLDASGLLGVFYTDGFASSSLKLMFEHKKLDVVYPKIKHSISLNFIPGEYTECPGVKRLLPTQILQYTTGKTSTRALLPEGDFKGLSEVVRARRLKDLLVTNAKNLANEFEGYDIFIALTGGKDSRVSYASLVASGVPFKSFTAELPDISAGDVEVPQLLARQTGVEHRYVRRGKFNGYALKEIDTHAAGMAKDGDRTFYSYGQYQALLEEGHKVVLVRSGIYENVIDYWKHFLKPGQTFNAENIRDRFIAFKANRAYSQSLAEWFSERANDEQNRWIGIENLFHWELRSGCWLSSTEQSFDVMDNIESMQFVNCRRIISLLMGYKEEDRVEKEHQKRLTSYICPPIANVPYDDLINRAKTNIVAKVCKKLYKSFLNLCWVVNNYGIGSGLDYIAIVAKYRKI